MINKEEVKKIANLARINLNEEDLFVMQKEISKMLDYFKILSEVDVSKISPFSFSYLNLNTDREDIEVEEKEDMKKFFSEKNGNYLKVKETF